MCVFEREREREREKEKEKEKEKKRERERETETDREREREREKEILLCVGSRLHHNRRRFFMYHNRTRPDFQSLAFGMLLRTSFFLPLRKAPWSFIVDTWALQGLPYHKLGV